MRSGGGPTITPLERRRRANPAAVVPLTTLTTTNHASDGARPPAFGGLAIDPWAHQPRGKPTSGRTRLALRPDPVRPRNLEPKQRIPTMRKSVKSRAEEQFAATQKKDKQALKDIEKARQERAEKVERLRALRLAKEAADKEAADKAAAAEAVAAVKAAAKKAADMKVAAKKAADKKVAAKSS